MSGRSARASAFDRMMAPMTEKRDAYPMAPATTIEQTAAVQMTGVPSASLGNRVANDAQKTLLNGSVAIVLSAVALLWLMGAFVFRKA